MAIVMRTGSPVTGERWRKVNRLLDLTLDHAPDERSAFLDRECRDDAGLRGAVERMLRACDDSSGFLEDEPAPMFAAPVIAASIAAERAQESPSVEGLRIGPYRVIREAGHGGMGVVYLAERDDDQYRRRVALKLMRGGAAGMADDHLARRFREERQILATLEHPGIARLLDGGVTDDGLPWFAMEYVEGTAIDRYCDTHALTIDERLALFCDVCDAVAFAHRNLVVHRDLKPSNILVTERREVKLLDFGIAKLLARIDGSGVDAPPTQTAVRALTPEYASPEQIRGDRIATASDVYSLGVILYELLTGHRPYAPERRSPHEIERAVLEEPVAPPSAVAPERLRRALRGDLDAIVLAAMRKEPERRYASADQLAGDLRRHRQRLPVTARRDGRAYRAGRFIRRHRTGVSAAAAAAAALVAFSVVTAVQSARLRAQAERITVERDRARQISAFLVDLFRSADPFAGGGPRTTVREVLDSGASRVDRDLREQPEVRAELLRVMGLSYLYLGLTSEARRLLERAIAIPVSSPIPGQAFTSEPPAIAAKHALAKVLQETGEFAAAESLYREVLDWRRRWLPAGSGNVGQSMSTLATVLAAQGRHAEAEALARDALSIARAIRPEDSQAVSQSLNNLGNVLFRRGSHAAAESVHREAHALRRRTLGDDNAETANSLVNIANALVGQGRLAEADTLFRTALAVKRARLGPGHFDVATDEAAYARLLHLRGDDDSAVVLYRRAIETHRRSRPDGHPRTATAMLGLGQLLLDRGDARAAEPLLRDALRSYRAALPPTHPDVARASRALDSCLALLGALR
ncbi:MAG TPA: serine/threonine-protein kinase [Gemmatimonadaceae bacterium]|nr:serine/threonine-protein kinase [Gemmatimonadaceae bacterium]